MPTFADRLASAVQQKKTPALVGLDPRLAHLPEGLRQGIDEANLGQVAEAFRMFCCGVIDAVAPLVPAVKPQAAFFERLGPPGMQVLWDVVGYARENQLQVVLDAKRNDIGSTAAGYADAYLGESSAWRCDALTVSPYLGDDSLTPFVDVAVERDAGIFVLVKTSNPGGGLFQDLVADEKPVYEHVARHVEHLAEQSVSRSGYGAVGAVVGATYAEQLSVLRAALPHSWLLVPGFGAQGGSAKDVAGGFDERGLGAIINSSRAVIFAHERPEFQEFGSARWQDAVYEAARQMIDQLRSETPAGRLG